MSRVRRSGATPLIRGILDVGHLSSEIVDIFEYVVEESLRPSVERMLTGTTQGDVRIAMLPAPSGLSLVGVAVAILRLYRRVAPRTVRNRCVFEPSCSHYSELAFRQRGFLNGLKLTGRRLVRCRSGCGGVDYSFLEGGESQ